MKTDEELKVLWQLFMHHMDEAYKHRQLWIAGCLEVQKALTAGSSPAEGAAPNRVEESPDVNEPKA